MVGAGRAAPGPPYMPICLSCGPTCGPASQLRPRHALQWCLDSGHHMTTAWHPGGSPVGGPLPKSPIAGLRPGPLHVHHVLREVQPGGPGAQHAGREAPVCRRQGRPRARPHLVQGLVAGRGGPRARLPLPGLPGRGQPLLLCSWVAGPRSRSLGGRPGWGRGPLGGRLEACPAAMAGGLPRVVGPALPVAVGPAALSVVLGGPLLLGRGLLVLLVEGGPVRVQGGGRSQLCLRLLVALLMGNTLLLSRWLRLGLACREVQWDPVIGCAPLQQLPTAAASAHPLRP